MACPFIEDPVDEEAHIAQRAFQPPPAPRVFQDRTSPLIQTDSYLWERTGDYKYKRGTTGVLTKVVTPLNLEVVEETVQTMDTS